MNLIKDKVIKKTSILKNLVTSELLSQAYLQILTHSVINFLRPSVPSLGLVGRGLESPPAWEESMTRKESC